MKFTREENAVYIECRGDLVLTKSGINTMGIVDPVVQIQPWEIGKNIAGPNLPAVWLCDLEEIHIGKSRMQKIRDTLSAVKFIWGKS